MKKILIINGHQYYEGAAEGKLTQSVIDRAKEFFSKNGFEIKETAIDKGYDVKDELDKLVWADYVFFQHPVYWMSVPWKTKKYMDEIFSGGAGTVTYANDGRSRKDPSKRYGSGGLLEGKYMLSLTYNCPESEFNDKDGFFEGLTLDQANYVVHKTLQFCGLKPTKTYSIHDVYKGDMDLESELKRLDKTLEENFS